MTECVSCGHALEVGRYCTNCGRPVTAEAPTSEPVLPPTAAAPPSSVRFPLYADEPAPTPEPEPLSVAPAPDPGPSPATPRRRGRAPWLPWVVSAAALALVAAFGLSLLLDDDSDGTQVDATTSSAPTPSPSSPSSPTTSPESVEPVEPAEIADVASFATASTAVTAEPNQDVSGDPVAYETDNMLDGLPATTWRMPGDGTGAEIVIALEQPTKVTRIGLVNGYAKSDGEFDWYAGNRRISAVEWTFDDGSTISQSLTDQRDLQAMKINPVVTETVRLRLVEVSKPGRGKSRRDYTAISDLSLVGLPA